VAPPRLMTPVPAGGWAERRATDRLWPIHRDPRGDLQAVPIARCGAARVPRFPGHRRYNDGRERGQPLRDHAFRPGPRGTVYRLPRQDVSFQKQRVAKCMALADRDEESTRPVSRERVSSDGPHMRYASTRQPVPSTGGGIRTASKKGFNTEQMGEHTEGREARQRWCFARCLARRQRDHSAARAVCLR